MRLDERVRVGLIGSGWITEQHIAAFAAAPNTEVVALADYPRDRGGRPGRGAALAADKGIARYYEDYRRLLEQDDVQMVTVALPNVQHAEVTLAALDARKHVVVEKPLCLSLEHAQRIVDRAREVGRIVGYAEQLCFTPKYVRAKALMDGGAIGRPLFLEQTEIHEGPYSDWFFDPELAGGGALMDMGCHAIEYARWMFDKAEVVRVSAQVSTMVHGARGPVDDHCLVHLDFEDGRKAMLQAGWIQKGGMTSAAKVLGTEGVLQVDLLQENGIRAYSEKGAEGLYPGWQRPDYEWLWNNGYAQQMSAFAKAAQTGETPMESALDGLKVLEIMWAAYASAAQGRSVSLPYRPPEGSHNPVKLWLQRGGPR